MSLIKIPQPHLWTPPPLRQERGGRRQSFERHFARSRTGLYRGETLREEETLQLAVPTIAQTNSEQSGASSAGALFTSAQTAGNTNVAFFAGQSATVTGWSINDTENNQYSLVAILQSAAAGYSVFVWVAFGIKPAGANVNQVNTSVVGGFGFSEIVILEVAGAKQTDPASTATGSNANSTTGLCGPITTGIPNVLMLCYNANNGSANGPGSGWTDALGGVTGFGSECEYQNAPTKGTSITGNVPLNGNTNWIQAMIGLAPTAPPVGTTNDPIFFGCDF